MLADHITICALLYGDYPQLARRCLGSIAPVAAATGVELRIGMNAVSDATRAVVTELFTDATYPVLAVDSAENMCKYPIMRHLFYELDGGVTTPMVMWFDDDSCVRDPGRGEAWLTTVVSTLHTVGMLGARYQQGWHGKQREWVRAQPWYTGKEPSDRSQVVFTQGAWWAAHLDTLKRLNYPWPDLRHRGGDVMLGEALFQQGIAIKKYNDNVAINADETLRESKAKRRGVDEKPIGHGGPVTDGPPAWPLPAVPAARQRRPIPRL